MVVTGGWQREARVSFKTFKQCSTKLKTSIQRLVKSKEKSFGHEFVNVNDRAGSAGSSWVHRPENDRWTQLSQAMSNLISFRSATKKGCLPDFYDGIDLHLFKLFNMPRPRFKFYWSPHDLINLIHVSLSSSLSVMSSISCTYLGFCNLHLYKYNVIQAKNLETPF